MKEQLYTIPVNDAFNQEGKSAVDLECPICEIYRTLDRQAIEFTLGPSYMEDDIRMETNKIGFCSKHAQSLYKEQNRLGLALMLHTHMQRMNEELKTLALKNPPKAKGLLAKKGQGSSALTTRIKELECSCYVCNRINTTFERYIITIFHSYKHDEEFRKLFKEGKGFCISHYGLLFERCGDYLSGNILDEFVKDLNDVYFSNMQRVTDDLEWFTDKFDYKNEDAPWKNSKDALIRSIVKTNSTEVS